MFRSERLDPQRPALRAGMEAAAGLLAGAVGQRRGETVEATLTIEQAADIVGAWSLVHGFAMLLLDDRLQHPLSRLPAGVDADALLGAILSARSAPR